MKEAFSEQEHPEMYTELEYPDCDICKRLKEALPSDQIININLYHNDLGGHELFPKRFQGTVMYIVAEEGGIGTYRIKIRIKGEKVDPRNSWTDHIDILVRSHTVPDISVNKVKTAKLDLEPEDLNKKERYL